MANDNDLFPSQNESFDYYDDLDLFLYHGALTKPVFYLLQIASPLVIFSGVFSNILAFVVLVRNRLYLKHEGYVYLAAIFCANAGVLLFCTSSTWLLSLSRYYFSLHTSEFMCRFWHFVQSIFYASGWLSVAFLFNVYLREHPIHRRRRSGCPMFAAKYCTLFASKVVVGVIFALVTVIALPYLAFVEIVPHFGCDFTEGYSELVIAELCIMWILPFLLFLFIIVRSLCSLREGNAFGFSQLEDRSESEKQVRVAALALSSKIFISQLVLICTAYGVRSSATCLVVVELAYGLSIVLQPVLCFAILAMLREGCRYQLQSIQCCRRLLPSLDRGEDTVQLSAIEEDPPSRTESCHPSGTSPP